MEERRGHEPKRKGGGVATRATVLRPDRHRTRSVCRRTWNAADLASTSVVLSSSSSSTSLSSLRFLARATSRQRHRQTIIPTRRDVRKYIRTCSVPFRRGQEDILAIRDDTGRREERTNERTSIVAVGARRRVLLCVTPSKVCAACDFHNDACDALTFLFCVHSERRERERELGQQQPVCLSLFAGSPFSLSLSLSGLLQYTLPLFPFLLARLSYFPSASSTVRRIFMYEGGDLPEIKYGGFFWFETKSKGL